MQYPAKKLMSLLLPGALLGLVFSGCAPYKSLRQNQERPLVASMAPLMPQELPPMDESLEDDDSAGALLERGFIHFHSGQPNTAAQAFSAAIATGNLNDAGRALAYWHIAECERRLADEDRSAEALSSFAVVAQDVLDERSTRQYAVDADGDFVEHFNLEARIAEARGYVAAAWARRVQTYGRSLENPIVMRNPIEREYFVQFLSACGDRAADVEREKLTYIDAEPVVGARIERITVRCNGEESAQFFVVMPPAPEADF